MMNEIATSTFNYATLNEIMPMIYKRFTEKSAEEWRQIYKALQLLEFLIKNGSERVIDDARTHLSLLKMLKQFHYIDLNGKDQGINVRNRAKELGELLGDVEKIRSERKKARANKTRFGGVEGGPGLGASSAGRYGGFGSETGGPTQFGGFSGGVYGDGGGFGGAESEDYGDTQARRDRFEEYDEHDEGGASKPAKSTSRTATASRTAPPPKPKAAEPKPKPKPAAPVEDLFSFGDDDIGTPAVPVSNGKQPAAPSNDFGPLQSDAGDDDEFDDFQSATPTAAPSTFAAPPRTSTISSATQFASPAPMASQQPSYANNIYSSISPPPMSTGAPNYSAFTSAPPPATPAYSQPPTTSSFTAPQVSRPSGYQSAQPNYYGSIQATSGTATPTSPTGQPQRSTFTSPLGGGIKPAVKSGGADPFASLSLAGLGAKKAAGTQGKGPSMADLNKERASAGIWGATSTPQQRQGGQNGQGSAGDLLGL